MKQIDIIEVRDAAELMRMVFAGREINTLKEIKLIVSQQAKDIYDQAIYKYAADNGIINSGKDFPTIGSATKNTTMVFPSGIKVTVTTDV